MYFSITNTLYLKDEAVEESLLEPCKFLSKIYPFFNCDVINSEIINGDKILTLQINTFFKCKLYLGRRYKSYIPTSGAKRYTYNSVTPFFSLSHYHTYYKLDNNKHKYKETLAFDDRNPLVMLYYCIFKYIFIPMRNKKLKDLNYSIE